MFLHHVMLHTPLHHTASPLTLALVHMHAFHDGHFGFHQLALWRLECTQKSTGMRVKMPDLLCDLGQVSQPL